MTWLLSWECTKIYWVEQGGVQNFTGSRSGGYENLLDRVGQGEKKIIGSIKRVCESCLVVQKNIFTYNSWLGTTR